MPQKHLTIAFTLTLIGCLFSTHAALAQRSGAYAFAQDPLARALQHANVFVGRTRQADVNPQDLEAIVRTAPAGMPVKIAVVSGLPRQAQVFGTRDAYTHALHAWLHMGRGLLIIETSKGISASTSALSGSQIKSVLQQYLPELQTNPTQGLKDVAKNLIQIAATSTTSSAASTNSAFPTQGEITTPPPSDTSHAFTGIFLFLVVFIVLIVVFSAIANAAKRARIQAAVKKRLENLHRQVIENISYADNYLDLLPSSPEAQAAKEARQRAAELDTQAVQLLRSSRDPQDYGRAEALLQEAIEQINQCRQHIDAATGGTGIAMAVEGTDYKVTPANAPTMAAPVTATALSEEIPPEERAVCFFCSRPARISELTPITIVVDGKRRKVLACQEDVRIVQQGAVPQIRTVSVGGRPVPWYAAPNYDPYRDYYAPTVSYAPVYASGDGFFEGFLLGSLLSPPAPIPYPVFVDSIEMAPPTPMYEPIFPETPSIDTGGVDFANNTDIDTGGMDFSTGTDFGVDTGGIDFGGDSGGADFGSDASSSDFGGGDF